VPGILGSPDSASKHHAERFIAGGVNDGRAFSVDDSEEACGFAIDFMVSRATWVLLSVAPLKPTGIDRPRANLSVCLPLSCLCA